MGSSKLTYIYKNQYQDDKTTYLNAEVRTESFRDSNRNAIQQATEYTHEIKKVLKRDYSDQLENKVDDLSKTLAINIARVDHKLYYQFRSTSFKGELIDLVTGPNYIRYKVITGYAETSMGKRQGVIISCSAYNTELAKLVTTGIYNEYLHIAKKLGLGEYDCGDFQIKKEGFYLSKETFYPVFARLSLLHPTGKEPNFTDEFKALINTDFTHSVPTTNSNISTSEVSAATVTTTAKKSNIPIKNSNSSISISLAAQQNIQRSPRKNTKEPYASAAGILWTLHERLKDTVDIVNPNSFSIFNLFDKNPANVDEAAILIAQSIVGFQSGDEWIPGQILKNKEDKLEKPLILILNTAAIKPEVVAAALKSLLPNEPDKSLKPSSVIGGNHWIACVILPINYLNKGAVTEQIFVLDSCNNIKELPKVLFDILTKGKKIRLSAESKKNEPLVEKTHILPAAFPNATIADTSGFLKQQVGGEDCGYWAVHNAITLVKTASIQALIQEIKNNDDCPMSANHLRLEFPYLNSAEDLKIPFTTTKAKEKKAEATSSVIQSQVNTTTTSNPIQLAVQSTPSSQDQKEEPKPAENATASPIVNQANLGTADLLQQTQKQLTEANATNTTLKNDLVRAMAEIESLKSQLHQATAKNKKLQVLRFQSDLVQTKAAQSQSSSSASTVGYSNRRTDYD